MPVWHITRGLGWGCHKADAKMANGMTITEWETKEQDEVLLYEFDTSDCLTADESTRDNQIAGIVRNAFYEGIMSDHRQCAVHCGEVHGLEAEQLRKGIDKIITSSDADDVMVDELRTLLDTVDAADSVAELDRPNVWHIVLEKMLKLLPEAPADRGNLGKLYEFILREGI